MGLFLPKTSVLLMLLLAFVSVPPGLAQTVQDGDGVVRMQGYVYLNGVTPESYIIESPEQLKAFVSTLAPVLPHKILPAPPNPDPFRTGFTVDFESSVIAVAVGRNRISDHPSYLGTDTFTNGNRRVRFALSAPTAQAYPFGWGVYSAVILRRIEGQTSVQLQTIPAQTPPRGFPRL